MRHDHQEFHGTPAAPVAPNDTHPRTPGGRFTGPGCVPVASPPAAPGFTPTGAAAAVLTDQIDGALRTLLASDWTLDSKAPAPVVALKASPGAGKSRATRARLAQIQGLGGDIVWHAPTLTLADEAAADARSLGSDAHTFRGRSATDPATGGPMCAKADLAEDIARLGLPVQTTLCRRVEQDGTEHLCPHFHACPYQQQRAALPQTPIQHYMPTSYLTLPSPTGRDIALRVIDETFWRHLIRIARVPLDAFVAPRRFYRQPSREPEKSKAAAEHADLLAAARVIADHLVSAAPLDALPLTAPELDGFAALEGHAYPPDPDIRPDQAISAQTAEVARAQAVRHGAATFARLWRLLAVAKRQGRAQCERIRIETDAEGARQVRLFDLRPLPRDAPILLLDADADPRILEALAPGARMDDLSLRPNAEIIQLADRRMSNRTLLMQRATRRDWCKVIRREVLFDRHGPQGGVLVGATRKVVRAFFEDAGHDFAGMDEAQVSAFMLDTPLHGAHWTWFGGRALGSNRYRGCSAVIVIGREELPPQALEDQGRAVFGDTQGAELAFLVPDEAGRTLLPEEITPYLMADGSGWGTMARQHPDPRIRALQRQARECATRQLIERLRLAHAAYRKRVILGSSAPIPDLPVDRLVTWAQVCPSRVAAACAEAFLAKGAIRLSGPGLHADAPCTFPTLEAAKTFWKRTPSARTWRPPRRWPQTARVRIRTAAKGARPVEALVLAGTPGDARTAAIDAFGPLAEFRFIGLVTP